MVPPTSPPTEAWEGQALQAAGCFQLCILPDVVVYLFKYLLLSVDYVPGNLLGTEK